MSATVAYARLPALDEPWRRLPWILPLSGLIWIGMLAGFSLLFKPPPSRPIEFKPIEARIVEWPPEAGGLQGGGGMPAPAPAMPKPRPAPVVKPKPEPLAKLVPKSNKIIVPPRIVSPFGTAKSTEQPEKSSTAQPPSGGGGATGGEGGGAGGSSAGGAGGIGNSNVGARAVFAPMPTIPDELREEVFQAEAVARFRVSYEGTAQVELEKPTSNARLNEILISTLRQWRFAPAVKDGVTIDSVFEIRIPVAVQ